MAREDREHYIGIRPYKRLTNCDKLLVFGDIRSFFTLGLGACDGYIFLQGKAPPSAPGLSDFCPFFLIGVKAELHPFG
jgi:hypothetical protein